MYHQAQSQWASLLTSCIFGQGLEAYSISFLVNRVPSAMSEDSHENRIITEWPILPLLLVSYASGLPEFTTQLPELSDEKLYF